MIESMTIDSQWLGTSWKSKIARYHMAHHRNQGVEGIDTDVPTLFEGYLITKSPLDVEMEVPSGKLTWLWKITIFNGKIHYFYGPFSIAMLNNQRVMPLVTWMGFIGNRGHHGMYNLLLRYWEA
jgi:hypothetical protein